MSPPCLCHSLKVCQVKAFITGVCNCESRANNGVPVTQSSTGFPTDTFILFATCGARGHAMLLAIAIEAPDHEDCEDHATGQHKVCAATVLVVR